MIKLEDRVIEGLWDNERQSGEGNLGADKEGTNLLMSFPPSCLCLCVCLLVCVAM